MKIVRFCIVLIIVFAQIYVSAQDNIPPVITSPARDTSFECGITTGLIQKLTDWYSASGGAMATDNSGAVVFQANLTLQEAITVFNNSQNFLCGNKQKVEVSFTAVDLSGNRSAPTTAMFFTTDVSGPVISTTSNVQYDCVAGIRDTLIRWIKNKGGYAATDFCSNSVQWTTFQYSISTGSSVLTSGGGSISNGPYPAIPNGICNWHMNINFFVRDECGNLTITPGTTTFSVADNVAPVFINPPADITVDCDKIPAVPTVQLIDYCDTAIMPVFTETSTQSTDKSLCAHYTYIITRTWSASDKCGNSSSHIQTISVRDTTPPAFTPKPVVNVSCTTFINQPDSIYLSYKDNCSLTYVIFNDSILNTGCRSTLRRRYTLTDVCSNSIDYTQIMHVIQDSAPKISKPAQNQEFTCDKLENFNALLSLWVQNMGGSTAIPSCGPIKKFAAIKGSFNSADPSTYPGNPPAFLPAQHCPSDLKGFLRYVEVDFVYYDTCGNVSLTSGVFGITDNTPPQILSCPPPVTRTTDPTSCSAAVDLIVPTVSDDCVEAVSPVTRKVRTPVTSSSPPGPEAIVDPVIVKVGPFNPSTTLPLNNGTLNVKLVSMDIDDVTEFFDVYDEDGTKIAKTPVGAGQCANIDFTLSLNANKIITWIQDGFIELRFVPNIVAGNPVLSINDICGASFIDVTITYDIDLVHTVRKSYKINGGSNINISNEAIIRPTLEKGTNTVTFTATDCAANTSECTTEIIISDVTPPIIDCPANLITNLSKGQCRDTVALDINFTVNENCDGLRKYKKISPSSLEASYISYIFNQGTGLFEARSKQLTFTEVFTIKHLSLPVSLKIEFYGDNNQPGEYFEIYGPGGYLIGLTQQTYTTGDCGFSETEFQIDPILINNWVVNHQITFIVVPKNGNDGLNPCGPILPGRTVDNISYIRGTLSYSDATFNISVSGATTLAQVDIPPGADLFHLILNGGKNIIRLNTSDGSSNKSSCSFEIDVKDVEVPNAKCKNAVAFLHPSGLIPVTVTPDIINNGSTDNCRIAKMKVVPSTFDCADANKDVNVSLIVEDEQGNTDSCSTTIRLKSAELLPTFTAGLCSTDTLKLFANVPVASVAGAYTFHWVGPGNIEFFTENPFIPNADESFNGVYVLTVTGFNNCTSVGSVLVNIKPLIKPDLKSNESDICSGDNLILSATSYSGNIDYLWYSGFYPNGVLLKTTQSHEYIIKPNVGVQFYYVIAKGPDCSSNPSSLLKITVLLSPEAKVNNLFLSPCEGNEIALGSPVSNSNFTYKWTGPNGYNDMGQYPAVIKNVSFNNAGDYKLVIQNSKCQSDTAVTRVVILERPERPLISSADIYCEGAIFTLVASGSPNAEKYAWYRNNILFTTTQDNSLIVPNAQSSLQGAWTVKSFKGDCTSLLSPAKFIAIDNKLEIGAINSGPVCMGDSVRLQATFVPNATYKWAGPVSSIPPVSNPVIPGIPGDYAVTITTPTGCLNNANTTVSVITVPEITALSNDSRPCMQPAESINFFPSVFPATGVYTYSWTGPNGFTSTVKNPVLTNLTARDTGIYTLVIFNSGCPSKKINTSVLFNLLPPTPVLAAKSFYCTGDTITVSANISIPGAEYIWQTPLGRFTIPDNKLILTNITISNNGSYTLQIKSNGCTSQPSAAINIEVRNTPLTPAITSNTPVCFGDTLRISTTNVSGIMYVWSGPNNPGNTSEILIPTAGQSNDGIYSVRLLNNGCLSKPSLPVKITVKEAIKTPEFDKSSIFLCKTTALGTEICFKPSSLQTNAIYRIINMATESVITESTSTCTFTTDPTLLNDGANFLVARAYSDGCRSMPSETLLINISVPPDIKAKAVENAIISCNGDAVRVLSVYGPPLVTVNWAVNNPEIKISDINSVNPVITGLPIGHNKIYLDYSINGCPEFTRDTVDIYTEFEPVANDDAYTLAYGEQGLFNILKNDILPEKSTIILTTVPKNGTATIKDNIITYLPDPRYIEQQTITYKICAVYCNDLCDEARVLITFSDDIACKAPNIFTPNDDGINDKFVIPCLETGRFPANKVSIFNEWGSEVYYSSPYKNNWDGTFGGGDLPAGTYFYILDTGDGRSPLNGFLILQR